MRTPTLMRCHHHHHYKDKKTRRQGSQTPKGKKNTAEKQPSAPQKAKKYKPMDSNEDDEEPQNEPGTLPVLPLHQGPAASSQGPVASVNSGDEDSEKSDEYSAQSQDSGRTVPYPDLYVMMNIGHSRLIHKYAAAAASFCFCFNRNGDQQDICNLTTMPCFQQSL